MKAIETRYKGHRFRSRTEARWAVLFDHLGVAYEYEPEGYELEGGLRYLPDFFLPVEDAFVEVKGTQPLRTEIHKAGLLAFHAQKPVLFAIGQPGERDRALLVQPKFPADPETQAWLAACPDISVLYRVADALRRSEMAVASPGFDYSADKTTRYEHRYRANDESYQRLDFDTGTKRLAIWLGSSDEVVTGYLEDEHGIEHLRKEGEPLFERVAIGNEDTRLIVKKPERSRAMTQAQNAARSARFEFGESGAG